MLGLAEVEWYDRSRHALANPVHLVASLCKPWRDSTNEERLEAENGLLLTPSIDHLFDRGFIGFEGAVRSSFLLLRIYRRSNAWCRNRNRRKRRLIHARSKALSRGRHRQVGNSCQAKAA